MKGWLLRMILEWLHTIVMILLESLFQVELVLLKLGPIPLDHRIWLPNDCFFSAIFGHTISVSCWWFLSLYRQFTVYRCIYIYIYIYIFFFFFFPIPAVLQDAAARCGRMQGCWDCDYHVCSSCEKKFQELPILTKVSHRGEGFSRRLVISWFVTCLATFSCASLVEKWLVI